MLAALTTRLRPVAAATAAAATSGRWLPLLPPRPLLQLARRGMAYEEKMKKYKPTSPGFRWRKIVDRSHLWKGKPFKPLTEGLRKKGGRNHHGRICVFTKGGGHKRRYRLVDFKRLGDTTATVQRLEYDPNRSAWVALIKDNKTSEYSYILAPRGVDKGDVVASGDNIDIKVGNTLPLKNIPVGTLVHNVELRPGRGGKLARAAGMSAQIMKTDTTGYALLRMGSQELRLVSVECRATIGVVSNPLHKNTVHGKAGVSRWLGKRPSVRGVAMNPVDHPHGGGQGKTSGGRPSSSPWGIYTKGVRTRKNKATDRFRVQRRKIP